MKTANIVSIARVVFLKTDTLIFTQGEIHSLINGKIVISLSE